MTVRFRELTVTQNGLARTVDAFRDDERGRRDADRAAWRWLLRSNVDAVESSPTVGDMLPVSTKPGTKTSVLRPRGV